MQNHLDQKQQPADQVNPYADPSSLANYQRRDEQFAPPPPPPPAKTKSKGHGFWRGCCAGWCCYCCLDACF